MIARFAVALALALLAAVPASAPFAEKTLAYNCPVKSYTPSDIGAYARASGGASSSFAHEYKVLMVCLVKSGYGIVACSRDSGYPVDYSAAAVGRAGTRYYYSAVTFANQGTRYSYSAFITC